MTEKTAPLGICDLCGEPFPAGVSLYTNKGRPRRYCSIDCRNAANARTGAPIIRERNLERMRRGEWQNPAAEMTDEERREYARRGARVRAQQHKADIAAGAWRNPADAPGAREKLSRPRVHQDNPALHSAMEKLHHGTMADLTDEERTAFYAHRRVLYQRRLDEARRYRRAQYRRLMSTEQGRRLARAKWQRQQARSAVRGPNERLRAAREQAGYSQRALAEALGVTQTAVGNWERFSSAPRRHELRQRVSEILNVPPAELFPEQ